VTVFLSDGRRSLADAFRQILDEQGAAIDWAAGVFLKPNIVFAAKPESGQITPPSFVAAFVRALRERRSDADIVMGDGVAVGRDPAHTFMASGFTQLARELNVPLIDLHAAERRPVPWSHGELDLPSIALDRVYINLPILKHSSACLISGALKNQKGLLTPTMKKQFHLRGLHEPIAGLNAAIKPWLTVMDCRQFFGPNVLISGDDCGEIDATACRLLGIDEPDHVKLARSAGVFADGFTVQGDEGAINCVAVRPEATETKRIGRLRLWSNPRACTGCRTLFRDAKDDVRRPGHVAAKRRLVGYSLRGAEIVMGSDPQWRREYRTVICVGSCTHKLAKDNGYVYVPGCPPSLDDLYDHLP
jgi:uncharacterized protein (DUF362 family)